MLEKFTEVIDELIYEQDYGESTDLSQAISYVLDYIDYVKDSDSPCDFENWLCDGVDNNLIANNKDIKNIVKA